jgi:hypothetical protein
MNNELAVALEKFSAKGAREYVSAGAYPIDGYVHVKGQIKVGEDYESRVVAMANPWTLLTVAMSKLNDVTVASIVREAEQIEDKAAKELKASANVAIQQIKAATLSPCKGKVTAKLTFDEVDIGDASITSVFDSDGVLRQ